MTEYQLHRIRFVEYKPKAVNCTAFEDSSRERLAVCREDGSIEVWCTRAGEIWNIDFVIPGKLERSIDSVTWCNSRLFTAGLEGEVIEWDLESLTEKNRADATGGPVWCIAASRNKQLLAAGCEDGSIRLFDIQYDAFEPLKTLDKQESRVLSLAWSKCGNTMVTGSTDGTIRVYNVKTGHVVSRISTDNLQGKSTLIWSIHLTSDMTIVSGDSLGQTQFWDAEMGTLLKSFKSHVADVLSVCVTRDEESVYSSGIDSRIAEFKLAKEIDSKAGEWRLTRKLRSVNHDIRTIAVTNGPTEHLIAGGVDPRLSIFNVSKTDQSFRFLPIFPDFSPCSFSKSKSVLAFHEANKIHLWKLPFLSSQEGKPPMPAKLLELKSPRDDFISCSDISAQGDIVIFSDVSNMFGYALSYSDVKLGKHPAIKVSKIRLPKVGVHGMQRIKICPDGQKVVFASSHGIGIVDLCDRNKDLQFFDTAFNTKGPWRILEMDQEGNHVAFVNVENEIYVFCLNGRRLISKVPHLQCRPMAVAFQPNSNNLVFVGAEKEFHIYDYVTEKLDHWCAKLNKAKLLTDLPRKGSRFTNIFFDNKDNDIAFLQSEHGFVKVKIGAEMTTKALVKAGNKRKWDPMSQKCLSSTTNYSSLLFMDLDEEDSLVVVECPLDGILNALPPALKVKRFGV